MVNIIPMVTCFVGTSNDSEIDAVPRGGRRSMRLARRGEIRAAGCRQDCGRFRVAELEENMDGRDDAMARLAEQIRSCRACPGLNIRAETESAPGYGNIRSPVVVVGQSLCGPCMATQVPFTGGSGRLLDQALAVAGLSKSEIFTTNVVHCHPPGNRPSLPHEISNCIRFLRAELDLVAPRLVIGLGRDARDALSALFGVESVPAVPDSGLVRRDSAPTLLFVHHPAYMVRRPRAARDEYIQTLGAAMRLACSAGQRG